MHQQPSDSRTELRTRLGIKYGWVATVAGLNRTMIRHTPEFPGKWLLWRVLNRSCNRLGVCLPGAATWGGHFRCDLRDHPQLRIYYFGVWEPNLTAFLMERLEKSDLFVDVGANVGYFSVLASRLVGDSGLVISLEASPRIFALLNATLELNRVQNVRPFNIAVAGQRGVVNLYQGPPSNLGKTSTLPSNGQELEGVVPADSLTNILSSYDRKRIRLIKIDVEGAEAPILVDLLHHIGDFSDDMEIIAEIDPTSAEQLGRPIEEIFNTFSARGFRWYVLENDYSLTAYSRPVVQRPRRGTKLPEIRTDVIFSRKDTAFL